MLKLLEKTKEKGIVILDSVVAEIKDFMKIGLNIGNKILFMEIWEQILLGRDKNIVYYVLEEVKIDITIQN